MQKTLALTLAVVCSLTLAAACFLAVSYLVLKGVSPVEPLLVLGAFVIQSACTLALLAGGAGSTRVAILVIAGAGGLIWLGWSVVASMLSSPHFEGYALVMGGAGVLQGALTLLHVVLTGNAFHIASIIGSRTR